MFSALAENHGDLQDKLNLFVALAPAASMKYCENSMIKFSADSWTTLAPILESLNQWELYNPAEDKALQQFCWELNGFCEVFQKFLDLKSPFNDPEITRVANARSGNSATV